MIGDWDRPMTSWSEDAQRDDWRRSSYTHSTTRQRMMAPSDIRAGRPEVPGAALFLQGRAWAWIHTTPYFSCPPWPQLLVAAMERWAVAPPHYPQRQLPLPELNRADPATGCPFLFQAGGRPLCERYLAARLALGHGPSPALMA